jgi:hypothetical protein
MDHFSELSTILRYSLDWNKARVACLVQILSALFKVRSVNLTQIAAAFQSDATEASSYRRIQRFFKNFSFDLSFIVVIVSKLFLMNEGCVLIMDRTNWKWGKKDINILMLSIEHFGIGIPIFWMVLKKGGSSSCEERKQVLNKIIEKLGSKNIKVLLADREFIGDEWFQFLIQAKIPFIIRVKGCYLVEGIYDNCKVPIKRLVKKKGRKKQLLHFPLKLWSSDLFGSVEFRKDAKEPLIVVSNQTEFNSLDMYRWRWGIETFFGCLKSRGFNIEDTHMTEPAKIEKLLFIVAIAFCFAYKKGELQSKVKPIKIKAHSRKQTSIFRLGLDLIRRTFFKASKTIEPFLSLLDFFEISLVRAA